MEDSRAFEGIRELIVRNYDSLRKDYEALAAELAQREKEKPYLESKLAEKEGDLRTLRELDHLSNEISRDRWKRQFLKSQMDLLQSLYGRIAWAQLDLEIQRKEEALKAVRGERQRIEGEKIPELEFRLSQLRDELPRLEAQIADLSENLGALRKKEVPPLER